MQRRKVSFCPESRQRTQKSLLIIINEWESSHRGVEANRSRAQREDQPLTTPQI